jgi:16S rRNA (guanine1207-N2)-methyltransferase
MPHYFSENNDTLKSNPKEIAFSVNGTKLKFKTDVGVFSKGNLDRGTKVLLDYLTIEDNDKEVLDLGCGYGVVGIYLAKKHQLNVDMIDINKRAVELSKSNSELNNVKTNVFESDGLEKVTNKYNLIVTNPPIRAGKKVYYKFFEDSVNFLEEDGRLLLVINKKHGAMSAIKFLKTIYLAVEVVGKDKGFNVISCRKVLTI